MDKNDSQKITEQSLYRQYDIARYYFETIEKMPDTPWILDQFIDTTIALSQTMEKRRQEFLLAKTYRALLLFAQDKRYQKSIRNHCLNQMHRLLDALYISLGNQCNVEYKMNFYTYELRMLNIN